MIIHGFAINSRLILFLLCIYKLQYVISIIMKKIVTILIVLQVHFLTKWEAHWS